MNVIEGLGYPTAKQSCLTYGVVRDTLQLIPFEMQQAIMQRYIV